MAIKRTVHEICEDCGETIARIDGNSVWWGGHVCKVNPPLNPQFVCPRQSPLDSIKFIAAAKSQVMEFGNGRPVIGDYIEFTHKTQNQYNVSWWCSDVVAITDGGGFCVSYDGGVRIHYINSFEPPYLSYTYHNHIYRVKP